MNTRAAFLDRDGIINKDSGYVHKWTDFVFEDGIFDLLTELQQQHYALIVITNQSGIARGFYSEEDLLRLHQKMVNEFLRKGIIISEISYCPHHIHGKVLEYAVTCQCRKPKPGMILNAATKLDLDLKKSIVIGDNISDMDAGRQAGVKDNFLVSRKYIREDGFLRFRSLKSLHSYLISKR